MSLFYVEWLRDFGKSNSVTALPQSICIGTFYIGGFVSGLLVSRNGSRNCGIVGGIMTSLGLLASYFATGILYLVLSLGLSGFGLSITYISTTTSIGEHFNGRLRVMALAFTVFGSGVGASIFTLIFEFLISHYGWRGTLLIEASIMLNIVVNATILGDQLQPMNSQQSITCYPEQETKISTRAKIETHSPISVITNAENRPQMQQEDKHAYGSETVSGKHVESQIVNTSISDFQRRTNENDGVNNGLRNILKQLLADKLFLLYALSCATSVASFSSVLIFLIDYYQSKGISASDAVRIHMYMNIVSTVFRLVPGFMKQLPHVSVLFLSTISAMLGCISTTAFPIVGSSYSVNLLAACVFGCGMGSMASAINISLVKMAGQQYFAAGLGLCMALVGIFLAVGGPIAGLIRDATGSYDVSLFCSAAAFSIAGISFFMIMVYRYCQNHGESFHF